MHRHLFRLRLISVLLLTASLFQAPPVFCADKPVTLQLRWLHQFQFAGFYAALHKGFYRDAGLDVTIMEGGPGINPVENVLSGKADFGISNSSLVIDYLNGKPVMLLGPIFQHSPNSLIVRGRGAKPDDLVGAGPIALMGGDLDIELKTIFLNEGIDLAKLQFVPYDRPLEELINGQVAALSAYVSNEPFLLQQRNIPFSVLKPQTYGLDFYGDALFTRQALEKQSPKMIAAFREASIRGWQYALDHPDEIIELILEHYNTQGKGHEHLRFEAKAIADLVNPDIIQIGHSNPSRWQHIVQNYAKFGVVGSDRSLDDFFYNPDRNKVDLSELYLTIVSILGILLALSSFALYIYRVNRRLNQSLRIQAQTKEQLRSSEQRYRTFFELSPSAGIIWGEGYKIIDWNKQAEVIFGWHREEVIGLNTLNFIIPETEMDKVRPVMSVLLAGKNVPYFINANVTKQGKELICEWFSSVLPDLPGQPIKIISLANDITDRKRQEQALIESESRMRTLFESTSDAVILLDKTGFLDCNPATLCLFGCRSKEEFLTMHPAELSPRYQPCGADSTTLAKRKLAKAMRDGYIHFEWLHQRIDSGETFDADILLNSIKINGRSLLQAVVRDITQRKVWQQELERQAYIDDLTGINNRRNFMRLAKTELMRAKRFGSKLSLLILDIDYFKQINDSYGHKAGDAILLKLADICRQTLREIDIIGRIGGEEFAFLLPETDKDNAFDVAERLREKIANTMTPFEDGLSLYFTVSIGVSALTSKNESLDALINLADTALYNAKNSGRNQVKQAFN